MKLRPYQEEIIRETYKGLKQYRKVLVVAPTGSGKTVITSHAIKDAISKGRKCYFIVHREELVFQTKATLQNVGKMRVGIIKAGHAKTDYAQVYIASAQTMTARKFMPEPDSVVIIDEVHTVGFYKAPKRIIDFHPGFVIGVTATPWRTKKSEGLADLFEAVVKAPAPDELTKMGFLSPARVFGYPKTYNLTGIKRQAGDYKNDELATACDTDESNNFIVSQTLKFLGNRTAIAFCVNVQHASRLAWAFQEAGIKSVAVHGGTTTDDRQEMYRSLSDGNLRVLTSVGVLTEGFDIRSIGMVIMARPTQSKALNVQMFGRGLRTHEDKKDCIVLDFAANYSRHGIASQMTREEMDPDCKSDKKGEAPTKECKQCGAVVHTTTPVCPECGAVFPPPKPKPKEDLKDDLVEMTKKGSDFHRDMFLELATNCMKKRYKLGKAKFDFKNRFGRWPTKWEMAPGKEKYESSL